MKKVSFIVIAVISLLIMTSSILLVETAAGPVELGNTVCPVSGEELVKGDEVKYEYKGVIYNLCCKMCLKEFKNNPDNYAK